MKSKLSNFWQQNKSIFIFVVLMMFFRSAVADWSDVPTGSMKPTIVEGDRIFVNKMAYDIRVPFTHVSLAKLSDPSTGDIVIFDSKASEQRLVKRVIGVPGDKVAMVNNQLVINGEVLGYQIEQELDDKVIFTEQLANHSNRIQVTKNLTPLSAFSSVTVPEDQYLVLGDNRNNSADSRVIGFVPRDEIVGKSTHVVFSLDYDHYFLPRADRFWQQL